MGDATGTQPVEMVVSGVEGIITMRWEDAACFYRFTPSGVTAAEGEPVVAGGGAIGAEHHLRPPQRRSTPGSSNAQIDVDNRLEIEHER